MTAPIRYQTIGGIRYRFLDLGCDDLELAAQNRKRIKENYGIEYWIRMEQQLDDLDRGEAGEWLPKVRKR